MLHEHIGDGYHVVKFPDGYAVCGDSAKSTAVGIVKRWVDKVPLIIADPPYGFITDEIWDRTLPLTDSDYVEHMFRWTQLWSDVLIDYGAFYVWGGIGKPGFRPFFKYLTAVEESTPLELSNLITWSKKRAYGTSWNYLFTREELAYFIKGDIKKPARFNIPYLSVKRGYAGYNKKYPARSEFLRRTNVWTDITEILRGKVHSAQKPIELSEVMIQVHTAQGEWVIDPFGGSFSTAIAARKQKRRFIIFEKDETYFEKACKRLQDA